MVLTQLEGICAVGLCLISFASGWVDCFDKQERKWLKKLKFPGYCLVGVAVLLTIVTVALSVQSDNQQTRRYSRLMTEHQHTQLQLESAQEDLTQALRKLSDAEATSERHQQQVVGTQRELIGTQERLASRQAELIQLEKEREARRSVRACITNQIQPIVSRWRSFEKTQRELIDREGQGGEVHETNEFGLPWVSKIFLKWLKSERTVLDRIANELGVCDAPIEFEGKLTNMTRELEDLAVRGASVTSKAGFYDTRDSLELLHRLTIGCIWFVIHARTLRLASRSFSSWISSA